MVVLIFSPVDILFVSSIDEIDEIYIFTKLCEYDI